MTEREAVVMVKWGGGGERGGRGVGWGFEEPSRQFFHSSFFFQIGMGASPERFLGNLPRDLTHPIVAHKTVPFSRVDPLLASERVLALAFWHVKVSSLPQNTFRKRTISRGCEMHIVFCSDALENFKLTCHSVFASDCP